LENLLKIIFACGGTAGHINPALAIASKITENKKSEVLFIGTQKGMEAKLVPETGFNIKFIEISGLNRKNLLKNFSLPSKIIKSVKESKKIISEFKPDFVIGTGGYVTLPVIYAAHKLGIKTLIHEVNSVPGLATKFLSKYADIITTAFEITSKIIKTKKIIKWVGNPLRPEIMAQIPQPSVGDGVLDVPTSKDNIQLSTVNYQLSSDYKSLLREKLGLNSDKPILLAFGGSLGAEVLNNAIEKLILTNNNKYQIIWATGQRYYDEIKSKFPSLEGWQSLATDGVVIRPYITNMSELLTVADLVITRAGGTLFELLALGKASIIIPSPNVTANHQVKNAEQLAKKGAVIMLLEEYIETLPKVIEQTLKNQSSLEKSALLCAKPNATEEIIKLISP